MKVLFICQNLELKFYGIGPGKVLSGMVKRTIKDVNCFSINSIDDINKYANEFKDKKILITGQLGGLVTV